MSDSCVCGGSTFSCDDIVKRPDGSAAVILACILTVDGRLLLKVEVLQRHGLAWRQTQERALWLALDSYHPVAWRKNTDGCLLLIE